MPLPLKEFVQHVLLENNRAAKIHNAVVNAWSRTVERYPERAMWQRKATFRGIVWEEIVRDLSALTLEDAGFHVERHRDTASFIIEQEVLFRVKHADLSLSTANYPTSEAVAFDDHEADLYGFTGMQRVELCYVLNEFETQIVWLGMSARSKGGWLWKIELTDRGIATEVMEPSFLDEDFDPQRLASLKRGNSDGDQQQPHPEAEEIRRKKKDSGS